MFLAIQHKPIFFQKIILHSSFTLHYHSFSYRVQDLEHCNFVQCKQTAFQISENASKVRFLSDLNPDSFLFWSTITIWSAQSQTNKKQIIKTTGHQICNMLRSKSLLVKHWPKLDFSTIHGILVSLYWHYSTGQKSKFFILFQWHLLCEKAALRNSTTASQNLNKLYLQNSEIKYCFCKM